jgi:YegS/Rv2252/BmrU family lipid kinase
MAPTVSLIVNPHAGGGRAATVQAQVERALAALGSDVHSTRTRDIEHARALARAAAAAGEVAATLGGDGLVGAVAGELEKTGGVLGILPGGRGNDLARVLGIPKDLDAACRILAAGADRAMDIGSVDGRWFVGIASAGFDSEANRIANATTLIRGNAVYAYAALRALAAWTPARFDLVLDGRERLTYDGYNVVCANSKAYGGGMFVAPDAELDDGLLDIVMTGRVTKRRFLLNLPKVFEGTHVNEAGVAVRRAAEVRVAADRPFTMYADGDPIAELPATVRIHHRALRVIAPA